MSPNYSDGRARTGREAETEVEPDAVLSALDDPDCRKILASVASGPSTASELIECCNLPSSTAYRKLDLLTRADLLEERTRLRTDGNHVNEYVNNVSAVTLEVSPEGVELSAEVGGTDVDDQDRVELATPS